MKYPTLQQSANAAAIVLVVGVLVFGSVKAVGSYFNNKEAVKTLTAQVASKDTEIGTLRENLSKTEEGKKAVEAAKTASDSRAKSAEAEAANKGVQLSTANAQLANVNRCVAKFNGIRPTILSYQQLQVDENDAYGKQIDYANAGLYAMSNYWNDIGRGYTAQANNLWPTINATLTAIASGNCY